MHYDAPGVARTRYGPVTLIAEDEEQSARQALRSRLRPVIRQGSKTLRLITVAAEKTKSSHRASRPQAECAKRAPNIVAPRRPGPRSGSAFAFGILAAKTKQQPKRQSLRHSRC